MLKTYIYEDLKRRRQKMNFFWIVLGTTLFCPIYFAFKNCWTSFWLYLLIVAPCIYGAYTALELAPFLWDISVPEIILLLFIPASNFIVGLFACKFLPVNLISKGYRLVKE